MKFELNKTKKRMMIGAAAGLVILLLLWMIFSKTPVSVETAKVERGQMLITVDGQGKTRFRDKFTVTAPVSGKMSRVQIDEGDNLPKGYVITEIDPNPPRTRPPQETENLPNPNAVKVYAPTNGKVLKVLEKSERILPAGTPIIEIGQPNTVEIVVDVLSTEATQIQGGAAVLVNDENNAQPILARVRLFEPQAFTKISALGVEEQRVNVICDFLDQDVQFGDNFRVDTRIIVWQGENVLKIPTSALFRDGEKWNVFVVRFNTAYRREVAVGHQNSAESEILEGLNEGETVILHPPNQLTDRSPVKSE